MYPRVTDITSLTLDQVDSDVQQRDNVAQKYIRDNHRPMGMMGAGQNIQYSNQQAYATNRQEGMGFSSPQQIQQQQRMDLAGAYGPDSGYIEGFNGAADPAPAPASTPTSHCVDVLHHCKGCPVCSRFYNNDNTLYLVIIAILAIFCIILLKKVLNV